MSNGVNALIARGGNSPPVPMPDFMRSAQGALDIKTRQNQLAIQQAKIEDIPGERAWREETRGREKTEWKQTENDKKFEREIKALSMATKAADPKQAEAIYKNLNPDGAKYEFDFVRGRTKVSIEGFEIEGPAKLVAQFYEILQDLLKKEPDPTKKQAIIRLHFESAKAMGLNITIPEKAQEKATYEHLTIYGPEGKTQRKSIKKGEDYTPPEGWFLSKPEKGEKGISEEAKAGTKKLTDIASDYQQAIGRYYARKSGVDIVSEALGKKSGEVAEEALKQAKALAKRYKELGGDPADLGVMELEDKDLTDEAIEILKKNKKQINEETIKQVMDKLKAK
ncbi:hypothetical protein KAR91_23105 [Candidatus Pacearchaeota archaeon]|nr:hypothetical protein [Candidatus Pacearchaeota archaeon]